MTGLTALRAFIYSVNTTPEAKKIIKELKQSERKLLLDIIQNKVNYESTATKKLAIRILTLQESVPFISNREMGAWKSFCRMMSNIFQGRVSSSAIISTIQDNPGVPPEAIPNLKELLADNSPPKAIKYNKGEKILNINKEKKLGKGTEATFYEHGGDSSLAVKIIDDTNEYELGAKLDHPVLAKTYNLYTKEYPDQRSPKNRIVMDKVEGTNLTTYQKSDKTISTAQAIHLLGQAKDCCSYLYREGICWRNINEGNIFIEDASKDLKLINFGDWHAETSPNKRTEALLLGAMEITGWIVRNSALVKTNIDNKDRELAIKIMFPEKFFENEQLDIYQVSSMHPIFYANTPWVAKIHEMEDDKLILHLQGYFDHVIEKLQTI